MGDVENGLIWMLDICGHTKLPFNENQLSEVLDLIYDKIRFLTYRFNWSIEQPLEGDKIVFCLPNPERDAYKDIIEMAELLYYEFSTTLGRLISRRFDKEIKAVGFNQFLFLGTFTRRKQQKDHATSEALSMVAKNVEKEVTARPNISIAKNILDEVGELDVQERFQYKLHVSDSEAYAVLGTDIFCCIVSPRVSADVQAKSNERSRFGVIPSMNAAFSRQEEVANVVNHLRDRHLCRLTGNFGVGKTAVALSVLGEMEKAGYKCLWFNCWRSLTFEFLLHAVASVIGQTGGDTSFVIDSLKHMDQKNEWSRKDRILVGALVSAGIKICFVLDNYNSWDLDRHTRGFFQFLAQFLITQTDVGNLCCLYVTTEGAGFMKVAGILTDDSVRIELLSLEEPVIYQLISDMNRRNVEVGRVQYLVQRVTKNLKLLKILYAALDDKIVTPRKLSEILDSHPQEGDLRDKALFEIVYRKLSRKYQRAMEATVYLRPLLSRELFARVKKLEEHEAKEILEVLSDYFYCLEKYDRELDEGMSFTQVYRVPPEFEEIVTKHEQGKPEIRLAAIAAKFFRESVGEARGKDDRSQNHMVLYKGYRYATFFYRQASQQIQIFELAREMWSRLIDTGVVAELCRDLRECENVVQNDGNMRSRVDLYMMWNRMWRVLFRMKEYSQNLENMYIYLEENHAQKEYWDLYWLEHGIRLTMLRDYKQALKSFTDRLDGATKKEGIRRQNSLRRIELRIVQTLISLNRPSEAREKLDRFSAGGTTWQELETWYSTQLIEENDAHLFLTEFVIPKKHSVSPRVSGLITNLQQSLARIRSHIELEVVDPKNIRGFEHWFVMKTRHRTTLAYLELKGNEALRSALLGYALNSFLLDDQTGRGVSLIQLSKIMYWLLPKNSGLQLAHEIVDRAISELHLRSQCLWWLATAYFTKSRIAIAEGHLDEARGYLNLMRQLNKVHKSDLWRQYEADYLNFALSLYGEDEISINTRYKNLVGEKSRWTNDYFKIEAHIEYGRFLLERGRMLEGLAVFQKGKQLYDRLWC